MKTLIFGKNGQIGRAFIPAIGENSHALDRGACDIAQPEAITQALEAHQPGLVINCAAYTAVDKAESEPALAFKVNADAPGIMAAWCARNSVPFIHFSTDYVFGNDEPTAWQETDTPCPINVYGESKLAGEEAVIRAGGRYLIFRISWVYDAQGHNFLNAMLKLFKEQEYLSIVSDQYGAPSYAPHIANACWHGIQNAMHETSFPTGIYHLCHQGETSWYGFADKILQEARKYQLPITLQRLSTKRTVDYPTPAKRPLNSRLDSNRAKEVLCIQLPSWQEGVEACMRKKCTF